MISFKPHFINARDLDDAWHQINIDILDKGREYSITSGSHSGSTRLSYDFLSGFIQYPHTGPLVPMMPEASNLPKPTTEDYVRDDYFPNYLMNSKLEPEEEYRYASWLVGGEGLCPYNQIDWVIKHFKDHGFGNEHCYITIGNPDSNLAYDRPFMYCKNGECSQEKVYYSKGDIQQDRCPVCGDSFEIDEAQRGTSPCLRGLDFRIIEGCLLCSVVYRSWDLYAGFPTNMGGFTLINRYIASELGIEPGPMAFTCKGAHAYKHHVEILAKRAGK